MGCSTALPYPMPNLSISLPTPAQMLQELRHLMPGIDLQPTNDPCIWSLQHDAHRVSVHWLYQPSRLELSMQMGQLSPDTTPLMYEALLAYNRHSSRTRGTRISLDGTERRLHIVCDQPAGQCTAAELRQAVLHIIDAAQGVLIWMDVHADELHTDPLHERAADESPAC